MHKSPGAGIEELLFHHLAETWGDDYEAAMTIYTNAFPVNEQQTAAQIKERISGGSNQLMVGKLAQEIVFMALLWPLNNTPFILLDYMATDAQHRGKKIGTHFLEYMKPVLAASNKYFILETEHPAFGLNREQREQRVKFYRSNGARQLAGIQFTLPALQEGSSTEMILMVFPGWSRNSFDGDLITTVIKRIYQELYNRNECEALANSSGYIGKTTIDLY